MIIAADLRDTTRKLGCRRSGPRTAVQYSAQAGNRGRLDRTAVFAQPLQSDSMRTPYLIETDLMAQQ